MNDSLTEYYANKDNCIKDLSMARKLFSTIDKNTTQKKYEQMERALSFMYIYCPEELKFIVHATLLESERRKYSVLIACNNIKE